MKVIFTVASMAGGGAERVISILANHLSQEGWQVTIAMAAGERVDYSLDSRIRLFCAGGTAGGSMVKRLRRIKRLRALFLQEPDACVVSFGLGSNFYTAAALVGLGNYLVISERNDPAACPHPHLRNLVFKRADALVFQTGDALRSYPSGLQKRGIVIPNPISGGIEPCCENVRKKTVAAVGRLEPQKNYPLLLRAFAAFRRTHSSYTLHIFGRGCLLQELQEMTRELGIENVVIFEGYVKNVHERIRDAGMYVLSSDYEGISNALLEAMALGLPVISTDCPIGGSRLCIEHEKSGLLVSVGDTQGMEKAMARLAENEDYARKLGREAAKVRERFSEKTVVEEWKKVLRGREGK